MSTRQSMRERIIALENQVREAETKLDAIRTIMSEWQRLSQVHQLANKIQKVLGEDPPQFTPNAGEMFP